MTTATTRQGISRAISPLLSQNLISLFAIYRQDGENEFYCSHDEDLILPKLTTSTFGLQPAQGQQRWISTAGVDISSMERQIGLRSQNMTVAGVVDGLSLDDLTSGRYLSAFVERFIVDARWPSLTPLMYDSFLITQVSYSSDLWKLEVEGMVRQLHEKVGVAFNRICRFSLGFDEFGVVNQGCGEDRSAIGGIHLQISTFTYGSVGDPLIVTAVDSASPRATFRVDRASTTPTMPLGRPYRFGTVRWLTGGNKNRTFELGAYDASKATNNTESGNLTAARFMGAKVQVGDTCIIAEGCDRLFATCLGTYGNQDNYGAYNQTPGTTRARQSPRVAWV